jgi:hypothetical protein
MWRQRSLHVAFTAREPIAYQRSQVIGRFASLPQHEMLAVGESGQNAKNSTRLANKMRMDHRNGTILPLARPCGPLVARHRRIVSLTSMRTTSGK